MKSWRAWACSRLLRQQMPNNSIRAMTIIFYSDQMHEPGRFFQLRMGLEPRDSNIKSVLDNDK